MNAFIFKYYQGCYNHKTSSVLNSLLRIVKILGDDELRFVRIREFPEKVNILREFSLTDGQ